MDLLPRFEQGDIRALSRIVSLVEDRTAGYREILGTLYTKVGQAVRIGLTGPPGAGKSTLVNALTHEFVGAGKKVGIIAVDPTSPFTGGALLGDRIRMNEFASDGRVYFRSMATRGATGGLAAATGNVAVVYDAFGFDVTLIETVGVGQMELDVVDACDTVVVVVTPESGDAVQTMKAGLMEIADIFCVNKADRPGVERVVFELEQAIDVRNRTTAGWKVPVVATDAVSRKQVDTLYGRITDHIEAIRSSGQRDRHRREQVKKLVLNILRQRFQREFLDQLMDQPDFRNVVDKIYAGRIDPFRAGDELYEKFAMK
ncbi:MAG: methylmalonyl Co-A mutase-associated GTPase MeaB [Candidatus Zixiibacteriota bacterium]